MQAKAYRAGTALFLVLLLLVGFVPQSRAEAQETGELFEGEGLFQGGSLEGPQRVDSSANMRMRSRAAVGEKTREDTLYADMLRAMTACALEDVTYSSQGVTYQGVGVCISLTGRGYTCSDGDDDKTTIYGLYAQIVNANPQWFYYVSDVVFFRVGEELSSVYLLVNAAMHGCKDAYEAEIAAMLTEALPKADSMSDMEKALALHDYIALRVRYHYDAWNEYSNHHFGDSHWLYANYPGAFSAYGAVVDKHAVCHGMALAYKDMLRRVGIQSYIEAAYSTHAGHAWNLVKIDDAWYHADINADDAFRGLSDPDMDSDLLGYVAHDAFLVSDAAYPRRDTALPAAPNDHPGKALWQDATSGMYRIGDRWYYSDARYSDAQRRAVGDVYACSVGGTPALLLSQVSLPACAHGKLYYYSYAQGELRYIDPTEDSPAPHTLMALPEVGEIAFGAIAPGSSAERIDADILYIVSAAYPAEETCALYLGNGARGDVDGDGADTVWDVLAIVRGAHGTLTLTPSQRARADANLDRAVDQTDADIVIQMILQ